MWIVLFLISCTSLLVGGFGNDEILGKGRWLVLNNMQCDDPGQYMIQFEVSRRKIDRTHDAFTFHADLEEEVNTTYGIEICVFKEVDGGFKFHQTLTDQSFCNMVKKYTGENFPRILSNAKIDPPDCPIPKGDFTVKDYVVDYSELEETGMYGTFDVSIYLTYLTEKVSCIRWLVRFEKENENGDDDDEDDDDY